CLHVIGFCVYFAVATQSQTGDASVYDDIVTTGVLGWSLMPLTALVESLHLDLQTDAAPVAIAFFVGNSIVWAGFVFGAYLFIRNWFVSPAAQSSALPDPSR
ncbi:MAG TPA: hypothetical protein VKS98_04165, partial [Chthoniobacterales bacterium]|nr:hypothetical protein [Chthoniobacterales bacterium]